MDYTGLTRRLRDGAVPSVFPAYPKYLQTTKVISCSSPKCRPNDLAGDSATRIAFSSETTDPENNSASSSSGNMEYSAPTAVGEESVSHSMSDLELTPRKRKLTEKIVELHSSLDSTKKKITVLQQKVRRQRKKLMTNKEVIDSLVEQKLLTTDAALILEKSLPPGTYSLVNRALNINRKGKSVMYDPELCSFALTLPYYLPKAYEYVRCKFNYALPSPRTIRAWYMKLNCEPGFSKECFNAIELHAQSSLMKGLIPSVCLSIDDMCLKEHVEFDGKRIIGYVDMGTEIENERLPTAKMA
ncbi:hypothetical protein J437_LFUL018980 [Ladona fulva]|uniref:THAP domain-containing protein 9 n=1 Tax=Ladona fulva TaxID=123851 RepID=A0A8K0KRE7_LADFU|nr:hypothetical protein J437_LFUL018980 [Ladona fulva]